MIVNLMNQTLEIDGNQLKISANDGRPLASICLDDSFIRPRLAQLPGSAAEPSFAGQHPALINIKVAGSEIARPYLISIRQLQIVVDREEAARGEAAVEASKAGNLETLRNLLATGTISEKNRGWAVKSAAANGHLEIVALLGGVLPVG